MSNLHACPRCSASLPADAPAGLCPKCLLQAGFESGPFDSGNAATAASPSGPSFIPPSIEALGKYFSDLEILELLGAGGMGAVYKARQKGLDRFVALKILPPHLSRDPAFVERFQREARALAKLSHKNIVAVYDFGQKQGLCWLMMEYIDGANLRKTISSGKLTPTEALAIVPQICEALQYAHDAGVVHRDIKPENILLDARGRVKIADFGLAKLLGEERAEANLTATQQVMGTLRYMAPEQMQGTKAVDHRADIFSLGVVFYELLTGELPVGRFAPPSQKVQVDVRLDEVVLRTLEQEPAKRYQRAADIKTDVETVSSQPNVAPYLPGMPIATNPMRAPFGPQEDPSLFTCAILSAVALGTAFVLPAILLAIPGVLLIVPFALFVGMLVMSVILGLVGRTYALGRYSAGGAGVLLLLFVLTIPTYVLSSSESRPPQQAIIEEHPAGISTPDEGVTQPRPAAAPTLPTAAELQGQWSAALALKDQSARDDALALVAIKASLGTQDLYPDFVREVAKDVATEIRDRTKRNRTLSDCAINLMRGKHTEAATEIAQRIDEVTTRENALREISGLSTGVAQAPPGAYVPTKTDPPKSAEESILAWRIGTWQYAKTMTKPYPGQQAGAVVTSEVSCRWILKKRFLQCDILQSDGVFYSAIEGYDPKDDVYTTWVFSPKGGVIESRKKWNAETRTLAPIPEDQKASDPTVTTTFPVDGRTEGIFITRDTEGRVTSEAKTVGTRTSRDPSEIKFPIVPAFKHEHPYGDILEQETGDWEELCVMHPSQTHPHATRGFSSISRKLVLGGRFLRSEAIAEHGLFESLSMLTSDPIVGRMRSWHFNSEGIHTTGTGVVDQKSGTVTYTAEDQVSHCIVYYSSPDKIRYVVEQRDKQGDSVVSVENTNVRAGTATAKQFALERFVGDWLFQGGETGPTQARGRLFLDGRFLLLDILPKDFHIRCLMTYDQAKDHFRVWQWEAEPRGAAQGTGEWNAASKTFQFKMPQQAEGEMEFSYQFQKDGGIEVAATPAVGTARQLGTGYPLPPDRTFEAPAEAAMPWEKLGPLTPFHGNWCSEVQDRTKSEQQFQKSGSAEHRWALKGYYLEDDSRDVEGKPRQWGMTTYDEEAKNFREWRFFANGGWQEATGVWNAESKTLDLRGTTSWGSSFISARIATDDIRYEWASVAKKANGEVEHDLVGQMTRAKAGQ